MTKCKFEIGLILDISTFGYCL